MDFAVIRSQQLFQDNLEKVRQVQQQYMQAEGMQVWKAFFSPYLAALSHNIAKITRHTLDYSFFCNSRSEAMEGAIKVAFKAGYPKRRRLICTGPHNYGDTLLTLNMSPEIADFPKLQLYKNVDVVPFNDLSTVEKILQQHGHETAAFVTPPLILDPFELPASGYFQGLQKLLQAYQVPLIVDESLTAPGLTGKFFAYENFGLKPDLVTVGELLTGGSCSHGAYLCEKNLFKRAYGKLKDGMIHTTTYNGFSDDVLACLKTMDVVVQEDLLGKVQFMENSLRSELDLLMQRVPGKFLNFEGLGLLFAVTLSTDECAALRAKGIDVVRSKRANGQFLLSPPLDVTDRHIAVLVRALNEVLGQEPQLRLDMAEA